MKKFTKNTLTGLALSVSSVALLAGAPAFAQDQDDQDEEQVDVAGNANASQASSGQIVVTGSRVRRDTTVSSISPLQVLETETARDVGDFDAAQILQRSEAAAGQQIDATFQGFVLDNGPGSQTLNLRGLGANRTLLLINGRRLAPAGVEGAPTSPSINLLPSSLIARYDLLLDGASSIYGSDAVAGVGNVVLRNDLDGLELFASGNLNPDGGGDDYTISGAWGTRFDRGFIGIGAEYAVRDEVKLRDREWFAGCRTDYEIDQNGNILRIGVADRAALENQTGGAISIPNNECVQTGFTGRIFQNYSFGGSAYYVGAGNGNYPGFPNFPYADSANAFGSQLDRDGDGIRDIDFFDFNTNGTNLDQSFITQQRLYNVMAYGEYTFDGDMNITPFFEALYSRAEVFSDNTGTPGLFPSVPDLNPFNPCNISGSNPTGVDCRLLDNFQASDFGDLNGARPGFFDVYREPGFPFARGNYGISLPVDANAQIRGDRNNQDVTQEQYRAVLGVRGDLPFIGDSWGFEVSGVYSRSEGLSIRRGIREDRLAYALGIDPTGDFNADGVVDNNGDGIADDYDSNYDVFGGPRVNIGDSRLLNGQPRPTANFQGQDPLWIGPCGTLSNPNLAAPDLVQGCVPVNLFADSIFQLPFGDFATQAERDYLFGERVVDTTYEQVVLSAYATGDLIELPAGPLGFVIGGEYRHDSIATTPDANASNGLFFGFFRDFGTNGGKYLAEAFAEANVPVFSDDFLGDFELNLAGRFTHEEFYGEAFTYSIRGGWRPVPQVLLKATYGTSFRAPNLRENFLGGITGFTTVTDPCAVPTVAFQALDGNGRLAGYQADLDTRDAALLAICRSEGRDPTAVGINAAGTNTVQASSIEVANQGTLDLDPETSRSFTTGVGVSESFGPFDLSFNFNYYSIIVEDSIAELSAQFTINDCYNFADIQLNQDGSLPSDYQRSIYCDQLEYSGDRQLVTLAFPQFLNQDKETVRGIDINANFGYEIPVGSETIDLGLYLQANHLIERSTLFTLDDGSTDFDEDAGEFGFPSWTGRAIGTIGYGPVTLTWQTRWIGRTEQEAAGIDPLSDAFGRGPDGLPTGTIGNTCLGNGSGTNTGPGGAFVPNGIVAGDGVFCRDIGFANDYFVHNASIRYEFNELLTLRLGVSNIFDRAPPLVDATEVFSVNNVPIGNGYDLDGREFFGSLSVRF